jgi:hypothetical protein
MTMGHFSNEFHVSLCPNWTWLVRGNDGSGVFAPENVKKYMIGCLLERKAGLELALPF